MHHMKRASVRDLRYHFPQIERLLREGQELEVTKRSRVIAHLVPARDAGTPRRPDFLARLKAIYGDHTLKVSAAELLREERERD
jgi:antitoxin (DNA-binding transcriptional repressor) of toxin-antitoxin stability system